MSSIPTRVLVAASFVVSLMVTGFVVVYALTPTVDRPELFEAIGRAWPALTAAAATIAAVLAGKAHVGNKVQAATLARVEHQTNGALREAVSDIVGAQLDARGLVPRQREDDPPAETAALPAVTAPASTDSAPVEAYTPPPVEDAAP